MAHSRGSDYDKENNSGVIVAEKKGNPCNVGFAF